jgi:hypothetical protein
MIVVSMLPLLTTWEQIRLEQKGRMTNACMRMRSPRMMQDFSPLQPSPIFDNFFLFFVQCGSKEMAYER